MLTASEELERLHASVAESGTPAPGFVEALVVQAANPNEVVERARTVVAVVIQGSEDGLEPEDPAWVQRLPGWFVSACSPPQTAEESAAWLARWRALDRAGKAAAEAELGWSLADWLGAVSPDTRAWWW